MDRDLTRGNITKSLILFALPMIAGNILQQFYNITDTLVVGRVLGSTALAAVGSAYSLMTFLTSIFLGLSMGAGALFSIYQGEGNTVRLRSAIAHSFLLIMLITILVNILVFLFLNPILSFLQVPSDTYQGMHDYLVIIFMGLIATSLYNFFSSLLRAIGNSVTPVWFLAISTIINIVLDLLFVAVFPYGIQGAAVATIIAQYVSGIGIWIYVQRKYPSLLSFQNFHLDSVILKEILSLSSLTCIQQSVMNFGILLVQGLINSFGTTIMAAFAAAVKIDTFAYLPVQDFGNAYSTFIAQNYGAKNAERIREGTRKAFLYSAAFSILISVIVCLFARNLMGLFISQSEVEVIEAGIQYLRIEGAFYIGIGILFLFYGYFRAIKKAGLSVVLTVISLGLRVSLAYLLSGFFREIGIYVSIPIGWFMADLVGLILMKKNPIV